MAYAIAILLPPLGMAMCGKVFQAILCALLMLTCLGWPVASIWAVLVVADHHADKRAGDLIRAIHRDGLTR